MDSERILIILSSLTVLVAVSLKSWGSLVTTVTLPE